MKIFFDSDSIKLKNMIIPLQHREGDLEIWKLKKSSNININSFKAKVAIIYCHQRCRANQSTCFDGKFGI